MEFCPLLLHADLHVKLAVIHAVARPLQTAGKCPMAHWAKASALRSHACILQKLQAIVMPFWRVNVQRGCMHTEHAPLCTPP